MLEVEIAPSMIVSDSGDATFVSGSIGEAGELDGTVVGEVVISNGSLVTGISMTTSSVF